MAYALDLDACYVHVGVSNPVAAKESGSSPSRMLENPPRCPGMLRLPDPPVAGKTVRIPASRFLYTSPKKVRKIGKNGHSITNNITNSLANMTNSLTDSLANMTIPGRTTPGGERSRSQMVVLGLAVSLSLVRTRFSPLGGEMQPGRGS